MKLKEKILHILNEKETEYISGEYMADIFNVSRNAIWKAINSLRKEGYNIYALQNKGYILDSGGIFTGENIQSYLKSPFNIKYIQEITSTNDLAMEYGKNGTKEGVVIVTNYQTKGRGRKGRTFHSPKNAGSYFSILLRPNIHFANASYITTAAAAAVTKTIREYYNIDAKIKWINDIYYNNKKICGILTEAHFDMESGIIDYVALGIGINIFEPKENYDKNIKNIAGAIFSHNLFNNKIRSQMTAKIIDVFYDYYKNLLNMEFLEEYKTHSMLTGKNIIIEKNGIKQKAFVKGIDDMCRLQVIFENGIEENLISGEVSLI